MNQDLVIGLDSSTQSTKAIAWTRNGEAVAEGRASIAMDTPRPDWAEQSVEDWWSAACSSLRQVAAEIDIKRVAGIAISNQRETVAFLDAEGNTVRPAIVWLDERARQDIQLLSDAIGGERLHRITGKPADLTPVIYRLNWLKRHSPDTLSASARILDVHGFLTGKLTGTAAASWTSADPFGVFDIAEKTWSAPLLDHLGMSPDRFGVLHKPGTRVGTVTAAAAAASGLAAGTPVIAAGGDGQCAGLGVNATRSGRLYLNLGTAIIAGAWTGEPRVSRYWRTMTSPTGEGYFLEGVQRAGAFFVNWFIDTFAGGRDDPAVFARLEAAAEAIPIGSEGLTVCPYLTGCMDPHWDANARASFSGLSPAHGPAHLYRAMLEALTLESARCITAMENSGVEAHRILAVGGGANSRLWIRMLADANGLPVTLSKSLEASSLGAAMTAAVGVGWFQSFDAAAAAMSAEGDTVEPDPATRTAWQDASIRQAAAYRPSENGVVAAPG